MPSRVLGARSSTVEGHPVGGADLLVLVLMAVGFWFLLIRPQRRRQQQMLDTQRGVAVGDEVMTHAGFFGRVTAEVDDPAAGDCLLLEIAPGTEMKIARGAVLRVVTPPPADVDETLDPADDTVAPGAPAAPETDPDHDRSN